jgi:transposase-like protein
MQKELNIVGRKGQKGRNSKYEISFKRQVARQYLDTNQSLAEVALQYGVRKIDVSNWKKRFSSELAEEEIIIPPMTEQEQNELEALKKQNETLKKKLEYEQLKTFALETMIDLAKTELGIDVRKNFGAKQPKK